MPPNTVPTISKPRSHRALIIAAVASGIIALLVLGLWYVSSHINRDANDQFAFIEDERLVWYGLSGSRFVPLHKVPEAGYTAPVIHATASELPSGDAPAIASVGNTQATLVGWMYRSGTFSTRFEDSAPKLHITSRSDATAVYTESGPEGPRLRSLALYDQQAEPADLGEGFSPRFIGETLIALSSEGVVSIDLNQGARDVLLSMQGLTPMNAAVSATGSHVVVASAEGTLDVYAINTAALTAQKVVSVPVTEAVTAVGFTTGGAIVARTTTSVVIFSLTEEGHSKPKRVTYAKSSSPLDLLLP